jgi:hypothetical protein
VSQRPQEPALVPALFSGRAQAEVAITQLRQFGVADHDIGVAVPEPGRYRQSDQSDREVVEAAGAGIATGAPVGSFGGMALVGLSIGEVVTIGLGGVLAAGTGGLLAGAVIGGLFGIIARVRRIPEEDRWCEVELGSDDVLVVVRVRRIGSACAR